jgi:hypothetical protein
MVMPRCLIVLGLLALVVVVMGFVSMISGWLTGLRTGDRPAGAKWRKTRLDTAAIRPSTSSHAAPVVQ